MIEKIFLDMDGVLVDFVGGMCARHGRPNPWREDPTLPHGDLQTAWAMSGEDFWRPSDLTLWTGLAKAPHANALVEAATALVGLENVAVLTSPTYRCHACIPGKVAWLEMHFPQLAKRVVFTRSKWLLARPGVLLVDDSAHHIDGFQGAGGRAILWPAPHNARRGECAGLDPARELGITP